jgi:hypothetical protein
LEAPPNTRSSRNHHDPSIGRTLWRLYRHHATGSTGDFLAAQGLSFEVFCSYYGSETCSFKNAANEKITFPKDLLTVTFDPQGRVIMSASWADFQAIAKEAGVTPDPAKLRWRFSHMNEMLDGTPQDVFPEP